MRSSSLFAAALTTLISVSAADAQYRGYQYSFGPQASPYQSGVRPAARPSFQYGGPSPFVWYSPHEGYSYDYQNGLPWRRNTSTGPIGRSGPSGVVRYSRPPHEPNDTYYVRSKPAAPNQPAENTNLQPAVAEQDDKNAQPLGKLPTTRAAASSSQTRRASAVKRPTTASYSSASIRANGGGDWVPNVPTRR
jgi:hypothetical protein